MRIRSSIAAVFALLGPTLNAATLTPEQQAADFDALWDGVKTQYAYLDGKATDWSRVREIHRPRAAAARSRDELIAVLEETLEELYDFHAHLDTNTSRSPRLVPSGADVWASWHGGAAVVEEVRPDSAAARAGIAAGMEVLLVDGRPVRQAAEERKGRALARPDPAADDWALRAVLAGRRGETRRLRLRSGQGTVDVALDDPAPPAPASLVEAREPTGGVGLIRFRNSLGEAGAVAKFDAALERLKDKRGLLLDLRDTPGGGNTTIARAILGRFVDGEAPYQKHVLAEEERRFGIRRSWLELVSPRGPFRFTGPVVVLVSHWTGSMGEGLAIGMDALGRATVVGTRMAGLAGATGRLALPHSGLGVYIAKEALFHVGGTPRETYVPPVLVDLTKETGVDPVLAAGLRVLDERAPTR